MRVYCENISLPKGGGNGVLTWQDSCHLALNDDNRHRSLDSAQVTWDDTATEIIGGLMFPAILTSLHEGCWGGRRETCQNVFA